MTDIDVAHSNATEVTMWFDPVCPFAWNTARWLTAAAEEAGFDIDWQLMNLAVLNEGREQPPGHQVRVGRLMASIRRELGSAGLGAAYFASGDLYFDQSAAVDDKVVDHVLNTVSARGTTDAALADSALDELVRQSHYARREALGETGGSPILRVDAQHVLWPGSDLAPAAGRVVDTV
jgi:2-hydroxychromene-2-carboxylate isomerase